MLKLEPQMAKRDVPEGKHCRGGAECPYCEFRNDRERRNALMSRDVRIVLCRLLSVAGFVFVVVMSANGSSLLVRLTALL